MSENCAELGYPETPATINCSCVFDLGQGANHEPPIGIGVGSLFLDIPFTIDNLSDPLPNVFFDICDVDPGTGRRYFKYTFVRTDDDGNPEESPYTQIDRIAVMTERGVNDGNQRGGVCFVIYSFESCHNAKLRLWLSATKTMPADDQPPDVIVDGNYGGAIYSRDALDTMIQTGKSARPLRYPYPARELSVVKWDVVNEQCQPIRVNQRTCGVAAGAPCGDATDDLYYFYVSFHHDDHE